MATQERGASRDSGSFFREVGEKKQNLRRIASEVGNMAAELQTVRSRAAAREAEFHQEAAKRKAAEAKTSDLEEKLEKMCASLEEARSEARSSASVAEQSLKELMDLTERFAEAEEIIEATASSANSLHLQCEALMEDLEKKNLELQQQQCRIESLERELSEFRDNVKPNEIAQKQLRYDVDDLEAHIELTMGRAYASKECEFRRLLNEVSTRNFENLEKQLLTKDDEISKLKQELAAAQAEVKSKSSELDAQIDKQQRSEQEFKMTIVKLEFGFQESQKQLKKLKKSAERKDQENQNLRAQVWLQEATSSTVSKSNFWNNFKLPGILSMSAVALICIIKR